LGLKVIGYRYDPWRWYRGEDGEYIWTGGKWEIRGEVRKWTDVSLHHLPFPKASLTNYTPMELVVVDLTGPMSVETWSGMSYAFIAVEMNSRMSFGELLASKDKVAKTLKMMW
jgi:hypothetical protein